MSHRKRPLRVLWKKRCRGRSSSGSKLRHVSSKNGLFEFYTKIVAEAIRFIENDLFESCGKNVAEEGVLQDRNRDKFHRKNGLFELYVKIVAEAIRLIENDLFEFCGKNVAEEEVLQDRNRDTFIEKRPLRVQCSNRCRSDTFHRKRPLRVQCSNRCRSDTFHRKRQWKNVAEEGVLQDRNRDMFHQKTASSTKVGIPTLLWNFTSRFVFGFFQHKNTMTFQQ